MKNRRIYSTRDRNCRLRFLVNGAVMGTILEESAQAVEIQTVVEDADDGDAIARIELIEDGEFVETDEPGKLKCEWKTTRKPEPGQHYYFVKVTQGDGNMLWSAPVWVRIGGE